MTFINEQGPVTARPERRGLVRAGMLWFALCLCGVSCARFTPPERGPEELPVPAEFTLYDASGAVPERWWEVPFWLKVDLPRIYAVYPMQNSLSEKAIPHLTN